MRSVIGALGLCWTLGFGHPAFGWGDEGHRAIALLAQRYMTPATKARVQALLSADPDHLTGHDIASSATWADRYRDSDRNTTRERYNHTHLWHFVDIELRAPNIDAACFGHPPVAPAVAASVGPDRQCVVDKVNQFAAELENPAIDLRERIVALKFLLHFVGDLHQPLHAADDYDQGGNNKTVSAAGFRSGKLHHYWDTEFVLELGDTPDDIAAALVPGISEVNRRAWSQGTPADWALQAFDLGRRDAYGRLPPRNASGTYRLDQHYIEAARRDVALQLSRAGVRLAAILNTRFGGIP